MLEKINFEFLHLSLEGEYLVVLLYLVLSIVFSKKEEKKKLKYCFLKKFLKKKNQ